MARMPTLTFVDGHTIPCVGLGTLDLGPDEAVNLVKTAVDTGYRHFDCAYIYGNEKYIGKALKEKMDDGSVRREDLFITTKLWCTFHRPEKVEEHCKMSLDNLGLDYLDLYLIHWPVALQEGGELIPVDADGNAIHSDIDYIDTWKAMQALVDKGLVRSIGVSNFNSKQLKRLIDLDLKHKVVCNQIEISPYNRNEKLLQFCKLNNIIASGYSPLGSKNRPWATADSPVVLDEPCIAEIATIYKKTPAQVVLRWGIQRGYAVLPKTVSLHRLKENIELFDFTLTDTDICKINALDRNLRAFAYFDMLSKNIHYPFHEEY